MKRPVYCIRDRKAGFMNPMVDQNDETAKRNFGMAVQSANSMFMAFPDDFELYRIGEFDSESGEMCPCLPDHICSARTFLVKESGDNV